MTSGSISFGQWPSRPISTALSVPWPRPVIASEPKTSARTRATRCRVPASRSHLDTKRAAARIGPTVCDELGPMPILNRSKVLTAIPLFYADGPPLPAFPARRLPPVRPGAGGPGGGARAGVRQRLHRRRSGARGALRGARSGVPGRGGRARAGLAVHRRAAPRLPVGAALAPRPARAKVAARAPLLQRVQAHPRADRDLVRDQAGVGPVAGADAEVQAAHGGAAGEQRLRARGPGEGQGHRLLHPVQRQHAVGGVAVLAQVAEAGRGVARLREGGGVEEGLAAVLAVVVLVAGGGGVQRDGLVQARRREVGRVEALPRLEAGEAAGEGLALVQAA